MLVLGPLCLHFLLFYLGNAQTPAPWSVNAGPCCTTPPSPNTHTQQLLSVYVGWTFEKLKSSCPSPTSSNRSHRWVCVWRHCVIQLMRSQVVAAEHVSVDKSIRVSAVCLFGADKTMCFSEPRWQWMFGGFAAIKMRGQEQWSEAVDDWWEEVARKTKGEAWVKTQVGYDETCGSSGRCYLFPLIADGECSVAQVDLQIGQLPTTSCCPRAKCWVNTGCV